MIIDHTHNAYVEKRNRSPKNNYNGAYYYSEEIVSLIIPRVETTRNWITVNIPGYGFDHSIVFIHNNLKPEIYNWLKVFKDLILVCGVEETVSKVSHIGKAIYLPLSIDVNYVKSFKTDIKKSGYAYVGRSSKMKLASVSFGENVTTLCDMPREQLLTEMNKYEYVYAVGRTAIEAHTLGCKVKPFDSRYPDPSIWKIIDSRDAAKILQTKINSIDKR